MTITWECECSQEELVWMTGFDVKWRRGTTDWSTKTANNEERELTLDDLADGDYQLSVCSMSDPGRGPLEETSFYLQAG